jgi:hypothetical protein
MVKRWSLYRRAFTIWFKLTTLLLSIVFFLFCLNLFARYFSGAGDKSTELLAESFALGLVSPKLSKFLMSSSIRRFWPSKEGEVSVAFCWLKGGGGDVFSIV